MAKCKHCVANDGRSCDGTPADGKSGCLGLKPGDKDHAFSEAFRALYREFGLPEECVERKPCGAPDVMKILRSTEWEWNKLKKFSAGNREIGRYLNPLLEEEGSK